jgi:hypothetical protein
MKVFSLILILLAFPASAHHAAGHLDFVVPYEGPR